MEEQKAPAKVSVLDILVTSSLLELGMGAQLLNPISLSNGLTRLKYSNYIIA